MTLRDGRPIGARYRVVRELARGGMGAVYEAQHTLTARTVALKILFSQVHDEQSARRFVREASASTRIKHPGIVEVLDAGVDEDGSFFVAMELLEGRTLREWQSARPTQGAVLSMFEQILDPLAAAHAAGLIHRDLKPENVFLASTADTERVKILDFGIARDMAQGAGTQTGVAMGTAAYMAPEQAMSAAQVTAAADVWAIGIMIYETLGGRLPFVGETATALVLAALTQAHVPLSSVSPHVPHAVSALVDACLEKDPARRPHDAQALLAQLTRARHAIEAGATMPAVQSPPAWPRAPVASPIAPTVPMPPSAPTVAPAGRVWLGGGTCLVAGVGLFALVALFAIVVGLALDGERESTAHPAGVAPPGLRREGAQRWVDLDITPVQFFTVGEGARVASVERGSFEREIASQSATPDGGFEVTYFVENAVTGTYRCSPALQDTMQCRVTGETGPRDGVTLFAAHRDRNALRGTWRHAESGRTPSIALAGDSPTVSMLDCATCDEMRAFFVHDALIFNFHVPGSARSREWYRCVITRSEDLVCHVSYVGSSETGIARFERSAASHR